MSTACDLATYDNEIKPRFTPASNIKPLIIPNKTVIVSSYIGSWADLADEEDEERKRKTTETTKVSDSKGANESQWKVKPIDKNEVASIRASLDAEAAKVAEAKAEAAKVAGAKAEAAKVAEAEVSQWKVKPIDKKDIANIREDLKASPAKPVAHVPHKVASWKTVQISPTTEEDDAKLIAADKKRRNEIFGDAPIAIIIKFADTPTSELAVALQQEITRIKTAAAAKARVVEPKVVKKTPKQIEIQEKAYDLKYKTKFPVMRHSNNQAADNDGFTPVQRKSPNTKNVFKVKTSATWAFMSKSPFSEKQDMFLHEYDIFDGLHYPKGWISESADGTRWRYHYQSPIIHVRDKNNYWQHEINGRVISVKELEWRLSPLPEHLKGKMPVD